MFYKGSPNSKTTLSADPSTATEKRLTRVVGYVRVSTEAQAQEGVSLDAQRTRLQAYAVAMDLELVEIIADEGRSAKSLNRRGLQTALGMLSQGKADALLVVKLDRLTRSVKDLGYLVETYFMNGRYSLLSVSDAIDTRSSSGRLILNVLGSVTQWEREACVERTKEAMAQMKADGYRFGIPYGYRFSRRLDDKGRQIVEPDPAQQQGLQRILALYDAGTPIEVLCRKLDEEGIPKTRPGLWCKTLLYRILKRAGRLPQVIRPGKPRKPTAELVRSRDAASEHARSLRREGLSLRQIGKRLLTDGYAAPRGTRWHASTIAMLLDTAV